MTTTTAKASPLRQALARKKHPTRTYRIVVDDPTAVQAALRAAEQAAGVARMTGQLERIDAAEAAAQAAHEALEACFHPVVLRSLPAAQFTALLAEHKPTTAQARDGAEWNPDTFQPALIAACAQDEGLTAEEWAAELGSDRWATAERAELFNLALAVNITTTTGH